MTVEVLGINKEITVVTVEVTSTIRKTIFSMC